MELTDIPLDKVEEEDLPLFQCIDWQEREFHTDFFFRNADAELNDLSSYSISVDGQLYKEILTSKLIHNEEDGTAESKEVAGGIERQDITAELCFQDVVMGKKHDYFIQFKALYYLGDLKGISLHDWEKSDNSTRKRVQEHLMEEVRRVQEKEKRVNDSLGYKIYVYTLLFFAGIIKFKMRVGKAILSKIHKWINK